MCLVFTSMSVPYLLSAPVGGWVADATGTYWPSILLSGAGTCARLFARFQLSFGSASALLFGAILFAAFLRPIEEEILPAPKTAALAVAL
jgi:hypothetical protein